MNEVVDPVCGMTISSEDAVGSVTHKGETYHFCSQSCLEEFRGDPERFLAAGALERSSAAPGDAEAEYTCPMHPEVRQKGPGACPICGMALEPLRDSLEEQPNEELVDMTRRFRVSLALTAPILALMTSEFLPGQPLQRMLPAGILNWVELALATPVVLWGGWPFFDRARLDLADQSLPEHVHAHRAGRRRRLRVQRRRYSGAGVVS